MAGNSISEVYTQIKLSTQGIYQDLMRGLNPALPRIEALLGQAVREGFRGASASISNELSGSIESGIQNVNFANITQGVEQGLNGVSFSNLSNDLSNHVSNALNSVSASGLSSDILTQVHQAVEQGAQQGLNSVNTNTITNGLQGNVSNATQAGAQQGLQSVSIQGSGIQSGTSSATESGAVSGFKKAGPAIVGIVAGLGIGAAVSGSITSALDKNRSETKIAASLNLDANSLKNFREASSTLFRSGISESREDINDTLGAIISSSSEARRISGKELAQIGKQVQTMVEVYDFSAAEVSQSASAMVKNGLAKDISEANSLIMASVSKAPAQAREEIIAAISEYGRNYKAMGLSGKEAMASLVNGAREGMMGVDKVGDSIKEVTLKVGGLDKSATEALESMGKTSKQSQEIQKSFAVGGEQGSKAFKDLLKNVMAIENPVKKQQTAIALFGTQMEDLGATNFDDFAKSILDADLVLGDVNKVSKGITDMWEQSSATQVQSFKNTVSDTFATLGETLLPQIMPILKSLTTFLTENATGIGAGLATGFNTLTTQVLPAILPIVEAMLPIATSVMGIISTIAEQLLPVILNLLPIVQEFVAWIAEVIANIEPLLPIIETIAILVLSLVAIYKVVVFFQTIATLVSTIGAIISGAVLAPIILITAIVAAIIGLIIIIVVYWEEISNAVMVALKAIGDFFVFLGKWVSDVWKAMVDTVVNLWNGAVSGLQDIGRGFGEFFVSIGESIRDTFMNVVDAVVGFFTNGFEGIRNFIDSIIQGVQSAMQWVGNLTGMSQGTVNVSASAGVPQMATGGDVLGATMLIAGEKDPETIVNRGVMNANLEAQNRLIGSLLSEDGTVNMSGRSGILIENVNITEQQVSGARIVDEIEAVTALRETR